MKRIILALVAVVMALNVSAQDLRWGAVGAVNFSWMRAKAAGVAISSDSYIGFQAGAKAEMDLADYLTDGFFADGALVYNLKGGSYSGSHTNLGYLQIPLNLGYRTPLSNDVSFIAGLGPYFGLGVLGKDVVKEGGTKLKTDVFGESMQRFDFGLNYKLGVEMWNQWQFYLGFEHSLLNLAKTDADLGSGVKYRLVNFYIGTSYMF
ncbi:MAG: outer membrane beta-barrel protein [Rikenellaceae bacterium]|nr:outer membrane beta-barrel protein [Rikenellaceae bacterium]